MAKVEQSTLSRSVSTTAGAAARQELINGETSVTDKIFPFVDEMLKFSKLPSLCYSVMFIMACIQMMATGFWTPFGYIDGEDSIGQVYKYIAMVSFFCDLSYTTSSLTIRFVITTALILCYYGIILLQAYVFMKRRRFVKWMLYVARFLLEFVPNLCLVPLGNLIGQCIYVCAKEGGMIPLVYMILSVLFYLMMVGGHYVQSSMWARSVYISVAQTACWSWFMHFILVTSCSILGILAWVVELYEKWMYLAVIICAIAVDCGLISLTTYLPFVHYHSNTVIAAGFTTKLAVDCLGVVKYFTHIDPVIDIAVLCGVLVISSVAWFCVTRRIVRSVRTKLSLSALENIESTSDAEAAASNLEGANFLPDVNKCQHYMNLNLHRNRARAELYMRIGISNHCELFCDWSLLRFISVYYPHDTSLQCLVAQYLSYFPCESRLLNYFFCIAADKDGLTVGDRFLIFQVHRVKGLRQSSASSEITDKLVEMKSLSNRGITSVRSFWEQVPHDLSILHDIRAQTISTTALFEEAIVKWPNNCKLCDDYSNFLIECGTDFGEGLRVRHRAELIEQGKNFVIDLPFRSLVRAYPTYLKNGIVDIKGAMRQRNTVTTTGKGNASQSSQGSSNSQISMGTIDGQLDAEIEDRLGKASFTSHRLRLAYQRALTGRTSTNIKRLRIMSIIAMIVAAAMILFLYIYFYNKFDSREENMHRQDLLNKIRYGYDAALTSFIIWYGSTIHIVEDGDTIKFFRLEEDDKSVGMLGNSSSGMFMLSPKTNRYNLQLSDVTHEIDDNELEKAHPGMSRTAYNLLDEVQRWIGLSKENIGLFISDIIQLAASGHVIDEMMSVMINNDVEFQFCDSRTLLGAEAMAPLEGVVTKKSLKTTVTYGLLHMTNLSRYEYATDSNNEGDSWVPEYNQNAGLCELVLNMERFFYGFSNLTKTIDDDQGLLTEEQSEENTYLMIGTCVSFIVVMLPLLLILLYQTLKELRGLLVVMGDLDKESKDAAAQPLKDSTVEEEDGVLNEAKGNNSVSPRFLYGNVVVFCLFTVAVFIIVIEIAEIRNNGFGNLNRWLFYGVSRGSFMLEAVIFLTLRVLSNCYSDYDTLPMVSGPEAGRLTLLMLETLTNYNTIVVRGSEDVEACVGQNDRLDQIHFEDDCHGNVNLGGFHDQYRCASLDRGINLFDVLVTELMDSPPPPSQLIADSSFYHMFHLMNCHLIDNTYEASEILAALASESIAAFEMTLSAVSFGGIAALLIGFLAFIYNLSGLDTAFAGALQLLRRLPPVSIVSNSNLLNYLLNKKSEKNDGKMTGSKCVIINAKDAITCLNRGESIEVVNKAVSELFGYTPEQLLGQPLTSIIGEEGNAQLYEQFELMRNGEATLVFEMHGTGLSDDDREVPISITVLGIGEEKDKCAHSFVVIMRDETEIQLRQQESEMAKKKSEDLLYQILPRDIVVRLNSGESDISFVVPSASVIFVDIVKFSEYAVTLTPAQIMENLSKVFAGFDACCAKQNLMTKIKLIGDVYMAAANLFTPDETATSHASQVVQFGLECLGALEETNTALEANLQIRIGVNTDGPLIAGVLGTDKPVFDIIGDTINVSARLQSTCIPGTVQISQLTYEAIANESFNVEPRGEIFLKGKGKKMAYIVRPMEESAMFVPTGASFANIPLGQVSSGLTDDQ